MLQNSRLSREQDALDYPLYADVNKGKLDLIVLRYMARSVHLILLRDAATATSPSLYHFEERRKRMHRIAIYEPQELQIQQSLAFVGFVSMKQQPLSASIVEDIHKVDRKLVAELVGTPGMLSYSSLELRTGNWYNLVLFNDPTAKRHIKDSETHKYAAYQLAPRYYEWIRLHSGVMPGGIDRCDLVLQKTKCYTFQLITSRPIVRELTYENVRLHDELPRSATNNMQPHHSLSSENVMVRTSC